MEAQFSPQDAEGSSPLEYDTSSSSSFEDEAARKERGVRLKYQIQAKICKSAEDSLGNGLLERHINKLSEDESTACESVVEQVRGSAAWSSFIKEFTTDSSQVGSHSLGKTSNALSGSPRACDKLPSGKSIEEHLQNYFIELIKTFTSLPAIKYTLRKSHYTRCMISSGVIPMGTPHINGASVDEGKIRPDVCIVEFTEIKVGTEQEKEGQKVKRYQNACPGVLPAEYLNGNGRSSLAKQPEIASNGIEVELATCARTAPTAFWENVLDTCSVKKECGEEAKAENIGECALWASEILRHQWNRQFVNVCCLCGTMLQLLRFDRSGCSVSEELDIREHPATFLKLMLSYFVFNYSSVGLNAHIGRSLQGHRVVRVNEKKFELGKQIIYPSKDSLICRGTAAFMAREMIENVKTQTPWELCYKISWINSARPHEGAFLVKLKDVRNVVECHGYDTGAATLQGRDECIFGDYTIQKPGKQSFGEQLTSRASGPIARLLQGQEHSPTGSKRMVPFSTSLGQPQPMMGKLLRTEIHRVNFSNRECRQLVMAYIPWEFDDLFDPLAGKEGNCLNQDGPPPSSEPDCVILRCWARLFETFRDLIQGPCRIMHRDVSFTNIRIKRVDGELIPVFTDWDMSAEEGNEAHYLKNKTGTPAFMAGQLLKAAPSPGDEAPHRWCHDVESAFWLCYLASIRFDKNKSMRSEFQKIHSHSDHEELGRYKISRLLRFKVGNEEHCVLPTDRPGISESLILMGACISPFVTESRSVDADRGIAQKLVEYLIRQLWRISKRYSDGGAKTVESSTGTGA